MNNDIIIKQKSIIIIEDLAKIIIYFFVFVAFLTSCSSDDDFLEPEKDNVFHILVFGNSFSRDAFSYVPAVMENIHPELSVDIEILCLNGKSLASHWDFLSNNKNDFVLDRYTTSSGRWNTSSGVSGENVISSNVWDIIVLQEGSTTTRDYMRTQSHIENISNYINLKQTKPIFAFLLHQASPEGSSALGKYTSDEVWELYANTAYKLLEHKKVDYVIPCGTGIQNARHTILDSYGDFGHLCYDKAHMQEGLPCLIEAYVASQTIFDILSIKSSILNSSLQITQQWVYDKNIPGQHGNVITGIAEDYELCKKCALLAIENPDQISIIP